MKIWHAHTEMGGGKEGRREGGKHALKKILYFRKYNNSLHVIQHADSSKKGLNEIVFSYIFVACSPPTVLTYWCLSLILVAQMGCHPMFTCAAVWI